MESEKQALLSPGALSSSDSYIGGTGTGKGAGKGGKDTDDEYSHSSRGDSHDEDDEEEEFGRVERDLFAEQLKYMRFVSGCCCQNTAYWVPDPWIGMCGCSKETQVACLTQRMCLKLDTSPICCHGARDDGTICQFGLGICGVGLKNCMSPEVSCLKEQAQICCVVSACALPTLKRLPATCGFCCMSCYPLFGCCLKFERLAREASGHGRGKH